jgi:hypothetical protein
MKATRASIAAGIMLVATAALAMPTYTTEFTTTYKIAKDSALKKANCGVCHVGMSTKFNPYGTDLKKVMEEVKTKKITADIFKKVEDLDSDKDGVKNIDEIKADTNPGDAKSVKK